MDVRLVTPATRAPRNRSRGTSVSWPGAGAPARRAARENRASRRAPDSSSSKFLHSEIREFSPGIPGATLLPAQGPGTSHGDRGLRALHPPRSPRRPRARHPEPPRSRTSTRSTGAFTRISAPWLRADCSDRLRERAHSPAHVSPQPAPSRRHPHAVVQQDVSSAGRARSAVRANDAIGCECDFDLGRFEPAVEERFRAGLHYFPKAVRRLAARRRGAVRPSAPPASPNARRRRAATRHRAWKIARIRPRSVPGPAT